MGVPSDPCSIKASASVETPSKVLAKAKQKLPSEEIMLTKHRLLVQYCCSNELGLMLVTVQSG